MPPRTVQVAFRLEQSLVAAIDAFAAQLAKEHPGLEPNRASAARMLITSGLEVERVRAELRANAPPVATAARAMLAGKASPQRRRPTKSK